MTESAQIPATLEAGQKAVMDALKAYTAKAALDGCFEKVDQATKISRLFEKIASSSRENSAISGWSDFTTLLWQQSEGGQLRKSKISAERAKDASASKGKTTKERFFRNKSDLVKTARPKSGKDYRHLAPYSVFLSVAQAAAKIGVGLQPFNFDDLLGGLDLNEGKPYQVRLVVLALRQANIFQSTHRGMYRCDPTVEEKALKWFGELPTEKAPRSKHRRRRRNRKGKG